MDPPQSPPALLRHHPTLKVVSLCNNVFVYMCVCVRACVQRSCVRACVRVCAYACSLSVVHFPGSWHCSSAMLDANHRITVYACVDVEMCILHLVIATSGLGVQDIGAARTAFTRPGLCCRRAAKLVPPLFRLAIIKGNVELIEMTWVELLYRTRGCLQTVQGSMLVAALPAWADLCE